MKYDVIVVGGGAAGMMAAIAAAEVGSRVLLIEKNEKLGKKLFITGKGRCNITNNCTNEDFFANIVSNHKFLYSAYSGFGSLAVQEFFEGNGLKLKEERGARIFPASDHSSDVISVLVKVLKRLGVEILLNTVVKELVVGSDNGNIVTGVTLKGGKQLDTDKIIVTTGGVSYPATGSTGDGFRFAEVSGHKVLVPKPALVPLMVKESWCVELQGLALKNITIVMETGGKVIFKGFGEMLFTHFGVSGPLILSASSFYVKLGCPQASVLIDLKPALSFEQLDRRVLRDFEENRNKNFKNILGGLLPTKLHSVMIMLSGISGDRKICEVTREERLGFVGLLKNLRLTVVGTRGFDEAIVTQGGVSVKDLNPKSMESRVVRNLYFAGEVIDVDGLTGGFNLQVAWSTGNLAGRSAGYRG